MEASNRKSGRRRQPSKRYSVDAFDDLGIADGDEDDFKLPAEVSDDEDDDFKMDVDASPEPPDDDLSIDGAVEDDEDDQTHLDLLSDDAQSVIDGSGADAFAARHVKKIKVDELAKMKGDPRFNPRGLLEPAARGSKELQRLFFFGPAKDDQTPALKSHYKWGAEPTVPSHKANANGFGGFKRSHFHDDEAVKRESTEGWLWYDARGGKEIFETCQQSLNLSVDNARQYLTPLPVAGHRMLMGSYKSQNLFDVGFHSSLDLNIAWTASNNPTPSPDIKSRRNGWMLNLGENIQHLEWVPNCIGSRQFLAVSTSPLKGSTPEEQRFNCPSAPAFTPHPPTKSSIQIWEVSADAEGRVNTKVPPRLRKVICTEWAGAKLFKWCPMPREHSSNERSGRTDLGLLAGVWADGALRMLDISVPAEQQAEVEFELIKSAAFMAQPPDTICTCLTWLSPTSIAAGCANGCVGIWNLESSLRNKMSKNQPASGAEPSLFFALSTTYILNVTSCYPSRPHILLSSSMSGHIQMTDLMEMTSKATMSPSATVRASRSRVGRSVLVWHDFTQVALTVDDNYALIAFPIRRFFRQISFTRYKSSVTCLACSPIHPFVMVGCVGGESISNNPLRRAYENKVPIWNQIWFTHEWRQTSLEEHRPIKHDDPSSLLADDATTSEHSEKQPPQAQGISRILEGFKCKEIKLFNTEDAFSHRENGAVYSTIYELKTAISAMGWNPNLHVGGWIAAGMASGLVRIENIAA